MQKILFHDVNIAVSRELAARPELFDKVVDIRAAHDLGVTETLDTPAEAMSQFGVWGMPAVVVLDDDNAHLHTFCNLESEAVWLEAIGDPAAYAARIEAEQEAVMQAALLEAEQEAPSGEAE